MMNKYKNEYLQKFKKRIKDIENDIQKNEKHINDLNIHVIFLKYLLDEMKNKNINVKVITKYDDFESKSKYMLNVIKEIQNDNIKLYEEIKVFRELINILEQK